MERLSLVILSACFGFSALAETPSLATKIQTEPADHLHFIGSGLRGTGNGSGISVFYSYRFNGNTLVGTNLTMAQMSETKEGGSLDTAQYYSTEASNKSTSLDLNTTYYFKENGYGKWGFLMRGGVGHSWNKTINKWGRYDRDPGFFHIGDDKRLRESKEEKREWGSTYARLGGYYQFLWGFKNGDRVGHVLELGLGGIYNDKDVSLSSTKPNGESSQTEVNRASALVEINYTVAF